MAISVKLSGPDFLAGFMSHEDMLAELAVLTQNNLTLVPMGMNEVRFMLPGPKTLSRAFMPANFLGWSKLSPSNQMAVEAAYFKVRNKLIVTPVLPAYEPIGVVGKSKTPPVMYSISPVGKKVSNVQKGYAFEYVIHPALSSVTPSTSQGPFEADEVVQTYKVLDIPMDGSLFHVAEGTDDLVFVSDGLMAFQYLGGVKWALLSPYDTYPPFNGTKYTPGSWVEIKTPDAQYWGYCTDQQSIKLFNKLKGFSQSIAKKENPTFASVAKKAAKHIDKLAKVLADKDDIWALSDEDDESDAPVPVAAPPKKGIVGKKLKRVPLRECTALGQPGMGVSATSTYYAIALGPHLNIGARVEGGNIRLHLRAEVKKGYSGPDTTVLTQAGFSNKGDYWSVHYLLNGVPAIRVVGAILMELGDSMDQMVQTQKEFNDAIA